METTSKKTAAKKIPAVERKVAPDIVVGSLAKRNSIDELRRDNPGKRFLYAPAGTSAASLSGSGLKQVNGPDGTPLRVRSRVICEDVGKIGVKKMAKAHAAATDRIKEVRDPKQVNSTDKSSVAKKPKS